MIRMQQQQINAMINHNQSHVPQQPRQPQTNYPRLPAIPPSQQPRKPNKRRIDPYKVLGLNKDEPLNEKILKKAYIRKARKYHPDKGGDKTIFQMVSIAYTVLKKKIEDQRQDLSHQELRQGSQNYLDNQERKI